MNIAPIQLTLLLTLATGAIADTTSLCDTTPRSVTNAQSTTVVMASGIPAGAMVTDLTVDVDMEHDWLGDLRITLTHAGQSRLLMSQPNLGFYPFGCGGRDIVATFTDTASQSADDLCVATTPNPQPEPMLTGNLQPLQALSGFDGMDASGDWTLTVEDLGPYDNGTLHAVCVEVTWELPPPPCGDANGDSMVDFVDLNLVLANWGTSGPSGDVAPAGGDGTVNFEDLNAVLTGWGAVCP